MGMVLDLGKNKTEFKALTLFLYIKETHTAERDIKAMWERFDKGNLLSPITIFSF